MDNRLKLHFEPRRGWINDPNGLCFWRGQYHAFFQHNPHAPVWAQMHWGHAVSDDLIHWEEKDIALFPDQPYENSGGCFSGSAVIEGERLWLFYTTVSRELGQTQSVAWTDDGVHFTKYEGNPVIDHFPEDGSKDFRDPKVTKIGDTYHMVLASGKDGTGKILRYTSADLLHWEYAGVLYENAELGKIYECPDFFPLDGRYVLMFSRIGRRRDAVLFVAGDFDGNVFTPENICEVEMGPHFYAPQTFLAPDGRRILIPWMHSWGKLPGDGDVYKGAFGIPRQLSVRDGRVYNAPLDEIKPCLTDTDKAVTVTANRVEIAVREGEEPLFYEGTVREVQILRDTRTVEVFINGGQRVLSYWLQ